MSSSSTWSGTSRSRATPPSAALCRPSATAASSSACSARIRSQPLHPNRNLNRNPDRRRPIRITIKTTIRTTTSGRAPLRRGHRGRLLLGTVGADEADLQDAPAVGLVDDEIVGAVVERFSGLRQPAELAEDEAADRLVFLP